MWEVREREGSPIIQSQALSCACFLLVLLQPSRRKFSMNFAALQFVFFSTLLRSFFASHSTPRPLNATRLNSIRLGVQLQSSVETTTTSTTLLTVVNNKTASGGKGKVSIGYRKGRAMAEKGGQRMPSNAFNYQLSADYLFHDAKVHGLPRRPQSRRARRA